MDDRWPVLVGVGEITQRDGTLDAAGLMRAALSSARADAGSALPAPDLVLVPRGMWRHPDPGRAAALACGSSTVRSVIAEIGILQQTLFSRAFTAVASGESAVCVVLGAEDRYRTVRGGAEEPGTGEPDEVLQPTAEIIARMEVERGLGVPAHQYALIESVLAHRAGRTPAEQTEALAELWAQGAAAAAARTTRSGERSWPSGPSIAPGNGGAWRTDSPSAAAIASDDDGNRWIATPYRKWLVSDWNVDQAAALMITTAGAARAAGIPEDRWVVPVAAAESNHMATVSARADPGRSPGMEAIGEALAAAGAPAGAADLREIYSCFPAAVQVQAAALGIDPSRGWTVTGGMTFGGGPLNNFVLQATAVMAQTLRSGHGRTGVVTCVSGMITKVGATAWRRAGEATGPWAGSGGSVADLAIDVTAEAERRTEVRALDPDLSGDVTIVAHTVVHRSPTKRGFHLAADGSDAHGPGGGSAERAIVLAESAAGSRTVATSTDERVLAALTTADHVGRRAIVADDATFTLA
jgi:acetyl-CoA C-acetyltransferase